MPYGRVLLVSADGDTRDLYADWFARTANLAMTCASSLAAARPILDQRGADVVLLDLVRPGQWDELRAADAATEGPPIVVLTGWVVEDGRFRTRAFSLGCAAFIAKPCHPRILVAVLRRVIDGERHVTIA
jgi:DNA-binding response OmpR family regulator